MVMKYFIHVLKECSIPCYYRLFVAKKFTDLYY